MVDFYKGWTATINNSRLVYVTAYDPVASPPTQSFCGDRLTVVAATPARMDGRTNLDVLGYWPVDGLRRAVLGFGDSDSVRSLASVKCSGYRVFDRMA